MAGQKPVNPPSARGSDAGPLPGKEEAQETAVSEPEASPEEARRTGLLARVDRPRPAGPDAPERWRQGVLLRLDRLERLLEAVVSRLPPIEELERQIAEDSAAQLGRLSESASAALERRGVLTQRVEAVRSEAIDQVQNIGGRTLQQIESVRAETLERLDAVRGESVEQVRAAREELSSGVAALRTESLDRLEQVRTETGQRLDAAASRTVAEVDAALNARLTALSSSLPGVLGTQIENSVQSAQERTGTLLQELRSTVAEMRREVGGGLDDVAKTQAQLAATVEAFTRAVKEERKATAEALRQAEAKAEASLRAAADEVTRAVQSGTEAAVGGLIQRIESETQSLRAEIGSGLGTVRSETETNLEAVRAGVQQAAGSLREEVRQVAEGLREEAGRAVDRVRGVTEEGVASVRTNVETAAATLAERQAALDELLGTLREQERAGTEATRDAVTRIEGLAGIIESLGRRRGFRELVETEEELREQQVRLVGELSEAGEALSARIADAERRVDAMAEVARVAQDRQTESADRVTGSVDQLRASLPGLAEELRDRSAEALAAAVGRARERDLADVRGRVERLEETIEAQMARLEELIVSTEALLRRMGEEREERRRGGLFRRGRE